MTLCGKVGACKSKFKTSFDRSFNLEWARTCANTGFNASPVLPLINVAMTASMDLDSKTLSTSKYRCTMPSMIEVAFSHRDCPSLSFCSVKAAYKLVRASSTLPPKPSRRLFTRSTAEVSFSSAAAAGSSTVDILKSPLKLIIFLTLDGSFKVRFASKSPALITAPAVFACEIFPDSCAMSGMTIFIASASAYGFPAWTSAPSSCKKRISLPVTSVLNSDGSNNVGNNHVWLSKVMRKPNGSSKPSISCVTPP
mmetsp:Transcript_1264/g.3888  ORF Transcript_1264/g.3888 Transcript_1264/m.3888 type:complete len:253 (-) Transcript_1264:2240-2998(-)